MATATLHGPYRHRLGTAYSITASTDEDDEFGPFLTRFGGFSEGTFGDCWTFEWQSKAGQLLGIAQRCAEGALQYDDALSDPEFRRYLARRAAAFRRREDTEHDCPDQALFPQMIVAMAERRLDPTQPDSDYGLYLWGGDPDLEALRALPLPRWAHIQDRRPKGKLLLVLERGRDMNDFEYWLTHRRSRKTPPRAPKRTVKTVSKAKRAPIAAAKYA